ncbi:MAG: formylglycine-generating enzyme family protein [Nitrospirae bacterium YQR-1]
MVSIIVKVETITGAVIALCFLVSVMGLTANASPDINNLQMVFVKGGCFLTGDALNAAGSGIKQAHMECLNDFYIGIYQVTQQQWKEVMEYNPSTFIKEGNYPVENVSWSDVQMFIKRLNTISAKRYRLPTEAEWEYACSGGGKKLKFHEAAGGVYIWDDVNSGSAAGSAGHNGDSYWIQDMAETLWKWFKNMYYQYISLFKSHSNPALDGLGDLHALGGGLWGSFINDVRCSSRYFGDSPGYKSGDFGFRLAIDK